MTEPIFFEIPIYRCSRNKHTKEMEAQEANISASDSKDLYPISHQSMLDNFHASIWYGWKYNEIIGYLNLYILGSQFRADVWLVSKKRINKGIIKKRFNYYGKALEKQLPKNKTSEELFNFMIEQLVNLNKRDYKKFYFDFKTFKVAARFINWLELVEKLNSYKYPEFRKTYFEAKD